MRKIWLILVVIAALFLVAGCTNKYATSGKIAMKSKNYEKAIHDFNLALEADSTNPEAHYLLGDAYKNKSDYDAMNKHYDAASRLSPKYNDDIKNVRDSLWGAFWTSGTEKAKQQKYPEALADFQVAIKVLPTRYEAYTNAGYAFQNMVATDSTYLDSAYTYYQRALDLDRTNVNVLLNFGYLAYNLGKLQQADSMFIAVLERDPQNIDALTRRGEIADQLERYEEAATFYNKALEIDPSLNNVWFNLGVVYFQRLKKLEDAELAFSRAVDLLPSDLNAQINLNVVLITNGKLDDAVSRLTTFTTAYPDECVGWDLLSQALIRKGLKKEALEADKKYKDCSAKR